MMKIVATAVFVAAISTTQAYAGGWGGSSSWSGGLINVSPSVHVGGVLNGSPVLSGNGIANGNAVGVLNGSLNGVLNGIGVNTLSSFKSVDKKRK